MNKNNSEYSIIKWKETCNEKHLWLALKPLINHPDRVAVQLNCPCWYMGSSTQQKGLDKYVDKPYHHAMFPFITHILVSHTYYWCWLSVHLMNGKKIKVTTLLLGSDSSTIVIDVDVYNAFYPLIYNTLWDVLDVKKNKHESMYSN